MLTDDDSDWKEFLKEQPKDTQLAFLKRANFIRDYIKYLIFNADLQGKGGEAMKYDRLRQFNDIRNKPIDHLARYQVGQRNMIEASELEAIREKNKFLIEKLQSGEEDA